MDEPAKTGPDSGRPRRRVTHADVARAVGVSRATVSYVLNDVPGRLISEGTRQRVLSAARELGHVPYAPARSLRLGRSDIVLVLVRDFMLGWVAGALLRRLDVALAERGYVMLIHHYDSQLRSVGELWQLVSPALVVAMGGLSVSEESTIELSSQRFLRLQGILPNARAGEMQVEYLAECGHRQLGYAPPTSESLRVIAAERRDGAESAAARLGLPEPLVRPVDMHDPATVHAAVDAWLAHGLTAVAAHNDDIALMITAELAARGLTPGKDLAVIGVDNVPAARLELTTIGIDVPRYAEDIVVRVQALLDDQPQPPLASDLLRLIVRTTA